MDSTLTNKLSKKAANLKELAFSHIQSMLESSFFPVLLAVLSFLLAGLLSVFPQGISEPTLLFFKRLWSCSLSKPSIPVVLYWLSVLLWSVLLAARSNAEKNANKRARDKMLSAIHKAPNKMAIFKYEESYREICKMLNEDGGFDLNVLKSICDFTNLFADKSLKLNANIMISVNSNDMADIDQLNENAIFLNDAINEKMEQYPYALYMTSDLMYSGSDVQQDELNPIALQVHRSEDEDGVRVALPGAPLAFLTGRLVVYENLDRIMKDCESLSDLMSGKIRKYFESGGGKSIKSFVSVRIDDLSGNAVGVLNVNSPQENILGTSSEYYGTYQALMAPILSKIASNVTNSAKSYASNMTGSHEETPSKRSDEHESN